jgi:hypothetical protein
MRRRVRMAMRIVLWLLAGLAGLFGLFLFT